MDNKKITNVDAKIEVLTDIDYTTTHVPMHARKSLISVVSVLLGFTFLSTTMVAGANIGAAFKFTDLMWLLIVGNLVLSVYVAMLSGIAAKTGLNSLLLARYAMGKFGAKWADIVLGGTQVVWYAVQTAYMGTMFCAALGLEQYFIPITLFWGIIMGVTALWGTKGMEIVAYVAIPPFVALCVAIPYFGVKAVGGFHNLLAIEPTSTLSVTAALTMIIGSFVSGGTNSPNWSRFAKTPKVGLIAGFIAFMVGNTVMIFSGMMGGLAYQSGDLMVVFVGMGIVALGIIVLIFNIWTTNTATAYAFGVAGAEFFNKPNKVPFVIGGLIIALIMAITGIYEVFIQFLIYLGIFIPPLGGILIGDFFFTWKRKLPRIEDVEFKTIRYSTLIAYLLGTLGAYVSSSLEIGIPSLNGILLSVFLVPVMNSIFRIVGIDDMHKLKGQVMNNPAASTGVSNAQTVSIDF